MIVLVDELVVERRKGRVLLPYKHPSANVKMTPARCHDLMGRRHTKGIGTTMSAIVVKMFTMALAKKYFSAEMHRDPEGSSQNACNGWHALSPVTVFGNISSDAFSLSSENRHVPEIAYSRDRPQYYQRH